jgi:predicted oxidoreductase
MMWLSKRKRNRQNLINIYSRNGQVAARRGARTGQPQQMTRLVVVLHRVQQQGSMPAS